MTSDSDQSTGPAAILFVDDQPEILRLLSRFAEKIGFTSDTADSATEAIALMERKPFDLIITDIEMPVVSGIELLKEIKDHWPELPVIIMTGNPSPEYVNEALSLGAIDYFTKPLDFQKIRKAIDGCL